MIKITTTDETYLLSCNNPEQLVLDINQHLK